ncbi:MAG TPA: methyltransferase domain-containing protein [Candidatus Dormibacteraeota bacterium]|nr:methyltransferase domain-containing protein [Candidatus Dormibacteraeota bacterium]
MKSKELFPAIFSRHAEAYDRRLDQVMARGEAKGRQRVIDLLEASPGMGIIDLGCGPGNLSRRIAALVAPHGEVVGIDLAPGMIERARLAAIPNARFEVMDMEDLKFESATFDGAVCGHALQFAPDLHRALTETRRVLRPGARLAASVPALSGPSASSLLDSVVDHWLPPAPDPEDQAGTRAVVSDPDLLRRAASAAGFESVRVETVVETVRWESAEEMVAHCASWWNCARRLESVDEGRRKTFVDEAVTTIRARYPGSFETSGRNLVLVATAP